MLKNVIYYSNDNRIVKKQAQREDTLHLRVPIWTRLRICGTISWFLYILGGDVVQDTAQ